MYLWKSRFWVSKNPMWDNFITKEIFIKLSIIFHYVEKTLQYKEWLLKIWF